MMPRGSGDHHKIGSPSLNQGKTPSAYARSSVRGARSPPTPTKPSGSAMSGGIHGTSRLPHTPLTEDPLSRNHKTQNPNSKQAKTAIPLFSLRFVIWILEFSLTHFAFNRSIKKSADVLYFSCILPGYTSMHSTFTSLSFSSR